MPLLEVLYSREAPFEGEAKEAFAREVVRVFQEVLGTQPERLRLVFVRVPPEDTLEGLREKLSRAEARED